MSDFKPGDKVKLSGYFLYAKEYLNLEGKILGVCSASGDCFIVRVPSKNDERHVYENEMEKVEACARCGDTTWNCVCTEE